MFFPSRLLAPRQLGRADLSQLAFRLGMTTERRRWHNSYFRMLRRHQEQLLEAYPPPLFRWVMQRQGGWVRRPVPATQAALDAVL